MTTTYQKQLEDIAKEEEALEKELIELEDHMAKLNEFKIFHATMLNMNEETNNILKELENRENLLEKEKRVYLDVQKMPQPMQSITKESYNKMMTIFTDYDYQGQEKQIESMECGDLCHLSVKSNTGELLMEQYIAKDLFF